MDKQTTTGEQATAAPQNSNAEDKGEGLSVQGLAQRFRDDAKGKKEKPTVRADPEPAKDAEPDSAEPDKTEPAATTETEGAPTETQEPNPEEYVPGDAEDEDVLSQPTPDKLKEKFKKRIGKLTYLRKQAEAQLAKIQQAKEAEIGSLRQQLAQTQQEYNRQLSDLSQRAAAQPSDPSDPIGTATDEAVLSKYEKDAKFIKRLYEDNLLDIAEAKRNREETVEIDGKTYNVKELQTTYNVAKEWPEQVKARREALAKRASWLNNSASLAQQIMPELSKTDSPEYIEAVSILRANPEIAKSPNAPSFMALFMRGLKAFRKEQEEKAKPAAPAKVVAKAPNLGGGGSAPAKVARPVETGVKRQEAVMSKLRESGSVRDLAKLFS